MANVFVENSYLKAIANAIRSKLGVTTKYKPSEMASAINSIVGQATLGTKSITANGIYDAEDDSLDGYSEVTVSVVPTGTKEITIEQNGTVTEDVSDYASIKINTNVSGGGGTSYSGTFTPTERVASYQFHAPNCTYIAIIATSPPSTSTGLAFIYACVGYVNRFYAAQSTNSGTNVAGANDTGKVTYANDTFTINFGNSNTSKTPQVGITYAWCAW